jgi:hypothetical protein
MIHSSYSARWSLACFKSRFVSCPLEWLSHVENYDIDVAQTSTTFVVSFSPTVRGNPPIILGGTVKYEIDRKTLQILEKRSIK